MTILSVFGRLVIPFFLPALTFDAVYTASITEDVLVVPAVSIAVTVGESSHFR